MISINEHVGDVVRKCWKPDASEGGITVGQGFRFIDDLAQGIHRQWDRTSS